MLTSEGNKMQELKEFYFVFENFEWTFNVKKTIDKQVNKKATNKNNFNFDKKSIQGITRSFSFPCQFIKLLFIYFFSVLSNFTKDSFSRAPNLICNCLRQIESLGQNNISGIRKKNRKKLFPPNNHKMYWLSGVIISN